jgi:hypothetical protein
MIKGRKNNLEKIKFLIKLKGVTANFDLRTKRLRDEDLI